jgi:hypothetical protein
MALERQSEAAWPLGAVQSGGVEAVPARAVARLYDGVWADDGMPERRGGSAYKSSSALGTGGPKWIADRRLVGGQRTAFPNTTELSSLAANDSSLLQVSAADPRVAIAPTTVRGILFWAYNNSGTDAVKGWAGSRYVGPGVYGNPTVTNGSKVVTGSGYAGAGPPTRA